MDNISNTSSVVRIPGVGRTQVTQDGTVIKDCFQAVSGSAYMKIPGFIVNIYNAGYDKVIIRLNNDHPNLEQVQEQITTLARHFPNLAAHVI